MTNWQKVQVVPWGNEAIARLDRDNPEWIELNFDHVSTKRGYTYNDEVGQHCNGTLVHLNNGASYVLALAPSQYPGADYMRDCWRWRNRLQHSDG